MGIYTAWKRSSDLNPISPVFGTLGEEGGEATFNFSAKYEKYLAGPEA